MFFELDESKPFVAQGYSIWNFEVMEKFCLQYVEPGKPEFQIPAMAVHYSQAHPNSEFKDQLHQYSKYAFTHHAHPTHPPNFEIE